MTAYTIIPNSSIDADSVIDVALKTAMRDNAIAIGEADLTVPQTARFGKLLAFTKITATDAAWAPNAKTTKIVVCVVGGGSGGAGSGGGLLAEAGKAGAITWDVSTSVSGTYAATIGAGSAGASASASSAAGSASSFIGTGISVSAAGGLAAHYYFASGISTALFGLSGETGVGVGGAGTSTTGGAAAANSGAGGGGGCAADTYAGGAGGSGVIFVWEFT